MLNIDDFVIAILVLIFIVISISIIKDRLQEEQKTELKPNMIRKVRK